MKSRDLKIGGKGIGAVKVPLETPETVDELTSKARGDSKVLLRWALRGYAIEHQERSGARDLFRELKEKGESDEQITRQVAELVNSYDPTKVISREGQGAGRSRKPKEVTIETHGKNLSLADMLKQLEAQGIKVNTVQHAGA